MKTNVLALAVLICLLDVTASSAHSAAGIRSPKLRGRVIDQTGAAISGVVVRLSSRSGSRATGLTDTQGAFEFEIGAAGSYLIETHIPGFADHVESIALDGESDQQLDVTLQVAGVDEHVVVTAAGTPQQVDEVSKSLTIVGKQELSRRQEYSLVEGLRPVPGLRVEQLGGPGSFSKIFIRGLRVVDTSVLIDGLRVRDAADFRGGINPVLGDLLVNNIDRVEVLRGSGSSLYGSNAVGGVINVVSEDGAGPPRFEFSADGGGLEQFREQGRISGGLGSKLGYSVSATRLDVNEGVHGDEVYRNTTFGARGRYNIRPDMSLRGTVTIADGFNRLTTSPFPIGPAGNEFGFATGSGPVVGFVEDEVDPDSFRDAKTSVASILFSHQTGAIYSYSLSFQSVVTGRDFTNGPAQAATGARLGLFEFTSSSGTDGRADTFNWTNALRLGRHQLVTAGLEAERERLTQEFTSPFFSTPRTTDRQRSMAFFAQDQITLLEGRLQLAAAIRTQSFFLKNPGSVPEIQGIDIKRALTGDGSIAYTLRGTSTKLRAHAGNSFRAPSLSERFTLFQGVRIGNPFLRPERAISFDAGVDQQLFNGKLMGSATYFYSRLQEIITSTSLLNTTNGKGGVARGFELSVSASPVSTLTINAAYTYTNSAQELPAGSLRPDNVFLPSGSSSPAFSIPRHSFSFGVNQRVGKRLNLNFDLYTASGHQFPLFDPIFFSQVITIFDGYTKADVGASYTHSIGERTQMTFYGKVDNVLDRSIVDEGFRLPGAVATGGVRIRF